MSKSICILAAFILFISCRAQSKIQSEKERVSLLYSSEKSNDFFMNEFLKFVKENDLGPTLVSYETKLIKNRVLKSTSSTDYISFFKAYVITGKDKTKRCVDTLIKNKLFKIFFTNSSYFINTEKQILANTQKKTKEYNFITYLVRESFDWERSLEYALADGHLNTTSKYFYLYCTLPICKQ